MSESCHILHAWANRLPRFGHGFLKEELPENGIYLVFEKGESAHGVDRIVRVGTHTGDGNLGKRIYEHLYKPNKDRSIFRKHVGRCLLADDPFLEQWDKDLTSKAKRTKYEHIIDFKKQEATEEKVGRYIAQNHSFVVFEIRNKSTRLATEKSLLSTITTFRHKFDSVIVV